MKKIVVLVSGGGTNLQTLINAEKRGDIKDGKITCVISSKEGAYALERARLNSIPTRVIPRKDYGSIALYTKAVTDALIEEKADLVVYAGFMTILDEQVVKAFPYKMINVHPALIPSFCGKGFYGLHVHEAVLKSGVKLTGATVHFVTEECDGGPIILQKSVPVEFNDTPESLQLKVMREAEWKILPKAVSLFCEDRITIKDGIAVVTPSKDDNCTETLHLFHETVGVRHSAYPLVYRGELTWKLLGRKMHVMTGQDVTPRYAKACFKSLNNLPEETVNSLCRSLKEYCLWYVKGLWKKEDLDCFMKVPVTEDTPPLEMLKNITPERLVIFEKINAVSYYIGCSCDWQNFMSKESRNGLGIGIFNDKVFFVGTDMQVSINNPNFNSFVNFAEGFKNY